MMSAHRFSTILLVAAMAVACTSTETAPTGSSVATDPTEPAAPSVTASTDGAVVADPTVVTCGSGPSSEAYAHLAFYGVCSDDPSIPFPVFRREASQQLDLDRMIRSLIDGTRAGERAAGVWTSFDTIDEPSTIDLRVSVDDDGVARIELLRDGVGWLPDTAAWTADQLNGLLDPLLATVFAVPQVSALDMSTLCMEQIACNRPITRDQWEGMLFTNAGVLSTSGCDPVSAWVYPDRCTLDGVVADGGAGAIVVGVETDDTLRMRSGPGAEYFQVGDIGPGASLTATDEAVRADDGGSWRLVVATDDLAGWVNEAYLEIERSPAEQIADAVVGFARHPSDATFAALPLADRVDLGLGPNVLASLDRADLRSPESWVLELDGFRAYTGPFSALALLGGVDVYEVVEGEHPHCASPPVDPPDGYASFQRISIQPRLGLNDSCLQWTTVDLFVDDSGLVGAVTLDVWEP